MARPQRIHAPRPELPAKLQTLRENLGFTEKEFGLAIGYDRASVIKYEGRMNREGKPVCAVPPVKYLHKVNTLKRALKHGLTKEDVLVADGGGGRHVVIDAFVAKNNAQLRRCRRLRCEVPFLTAVHNQIFCSVECRMAHYRGR